MRKLVLAILAVVVLAPLYLETIVRRLFASRAAVGIGATALVVLVTGVAMRPAAAEAVPSFATVEPPGAAFREVETDQPLGAPIAITFTTPMDTASVASAVRIEPGVPVELTWDVTATTLLITPADGWQPATYHLATVAGSARDREGRELGQPVRAAFVSRDAARARIEAEQILDGRATVTTSFVLTFDRPVDPASVRTGFTVEPPAAGAFEPVVKRRPVTRMVFRPAAPLDPATTYRVALGVARDVDGAPVGNAETVVATVEAPSVVRFRPRTGTGEVARDAAISVRFTQPMARSATKKAFRVTADGKPVSGRVSWAEGDTVLVFRPARTLPYGATVRVVVAEDARSAGGAAIPKPVTGTFTTEPKPTPPPKPAPAARVAGGSSSSAARTSVVKPRSTSLLAGERYMVDLINCIRAGGYVASTGACSGRGGTSLRPLKLDVGISDRVARPYAKRLVAAGVCSHFYGGNPGHRLKASGYSSYRWAENLGCRYTTDARLATIRLIRFFQAERSWNGGHWRNMMDPRFDRVGVGLWIADGKLRFVMDFYRP